MMWVYGCLSEDTEILVDGQWEHYHKAVTGKHAMCYDIESGELSWQRIEETYDYDYDDTAYSIQSDHTDQVVSKNHRCIIEQGGKEVFQLAEDAARELETRVPVLENLQDLLDALPLPHEGAGDTESVLRRSVLSEMDPAVFRAAKTYWFKSAPGHEGGDIFHNETFGAPFAMTLSSL